MNTPRSTLTSGAPEPQRGYAPSAVPLLVHRQVLSDLEDAQRHIQALTQDNQRLQQQNLELLAEVDRVVKAVRRLQGLAEHCLPAEQADLGLAESLPAPRAVEYGDQPDFLPPRSPQVSPYPPSPHQYTEVQDPVFYPPEEATRLQREGGGWWLILTVLLIVVTAFGTGFLIVRPFLVHPNSGK